MLVGVWCFTHRGVMFLNIAFLLGVVMVFAGALSILIHFFAPGKKDGKEAKEGFGWFCAEGLFTFICGTLVLGNQLATDSMVPIFFGMWLLFSGVVRVVAALPLFFAKDKAWMPTLAAGVLATAFGIYAFFNQGMISPMPIVILVGIIFLIQGVNILVHGVLMPAKSKFSLRGKIGQLWKDSD